MGAAFLFALACNLDTVLLAAAFSLRGVHLSAAAKLILATVTTAVTAVSLALGRALHGVLQGGIGDTVGGLGLLGMGFWILLEYLRGQSDPSGVNAAPKNHWGVVQLAAALAVNNAGVGAAAGASGLPLLWGCTANFIVTLLCLPGGRLLAKSPLGRRLERWAFPLSGALLILLGALELWI